MSRLSHKRVLEVLPMTEATGPIPSGDEVSQFASGYEALPGPSGTTGGDPTGWRAPEPRAHLAEITITRKKWTDSGIISRCELCKESVVRVEWVETIRHVSQFHQGDLSPDVRLETGKVSSLESPLSLLLSATEVENIAKLEVMHREVTKLDISKSPEADQTLTGPVLALRFTPDEVEELVRTAALALYGKANHGELTQHQRELAAKAWLLMREATV